MLPTRLSSSAGNGVGAPVSGTGLPSWTGFTTFNGPAAQASSNSSSVIHMASVGSIAFVGK